MISSTASQQAKHKSLGFTLYLSLFHGFRPRQIQCTQEITALKITEITAPARHRLVPKSSLVEFVRSYFQFAWITIGIIFKICSRRTNLE